MSKVIELTKQNFNKKVTIQYPFLVDLGGAWCQPCLIMAPILDGLSEEFDGKLKIGKLNMELPEHQPLAIKYHVQAIPNMKLFKKGKVIKEFVGLKSKRDF
jgi:thioredoxin 1